jgi:hypothetical protein
MLIQYTVHGIEGQRLVTEPWHKRNHEAMASKRHVWGSEGNRHEMNGMLAAYEDLLKSMKLELTVAKSGSVFFASLSSGRLFCWFPGWAVPCRSLFVFESAPNASNWSIFFPVMSSFLPFVSWQQYTGHPLSFLNLRTCLGQMLWGLHAGKIPLCDGAKPSETAKTHASIRDPRMARATGPRTFPPRTQTQTQTKVEETQTVAWTGYR